MKINLHPIFGLLFMLIVMAAFLTIPVIAFYVLPRSIVWITNYLLHFVGLSLPFNLFTWAISMYILWITGAVRVLTRELKTAVGNLKAQ